MSGKGLDKDPVYQRELREFATGMLAGQYLRQVMAGEIPVSGVRKIQEVLLKTREEAEALKARIESGELTTYQAAADYSIAPGPGSSWGMWAGWPRGAPSRRSTR